MHAENFAKGAAGMLLQYAILTCVSLANSVVSEMLGHRWDFSLCDYL